MACQAQSEDSFDSKSVTKQSSCFLLFQSKADFMFGIDNEYCQCPIFPLKNIKVTKYTQSTTFTYYNIANTVKVCHMTQIKVLNRLLNN